ncbi:hypothetical protein D4R86_00980 [bacterium]|nr:MAG: hypothetical protein D4R86_00980 [bacterium]
MSSLNISLLNYLYEERERIDGRIEECLKGGIYRDVVGLRGNSITKNNIAKVIEEVLGRSKRSWFDFVIALEAPGRSHSLTKHVFIFGERGIIRDRLEEISEFAFYLKSFRRYCLWIGNSEQDKPNIKELIC